MYSKNIYNILGYTPGGESSKRYCEIIRFIKHIAKVPGLKRPITIFPDAYIKEWGFPSGICLQSSVKDGILLPAAVSDIGCGFRVIKTNLYKDDINLETAKELVDAIDGFSGSESSYRIAAIETLDLDKIFCNGVEYLIEQGIGQESDLLKIQNYSAKSRVDPKISFANEPTIMKGFGISSSHFLEIRYIGEILDKKTALLYGLDLKQVIIIMHAGAIPEKDSFLSGYYYPALEYSIQNNLFSQKLIEEGIFGVPLKSDIGQDYLGATSALINYSYASRHFASKLVLEAFRYIVGAHVEFDLISDICHSKFEVYDGNLFQLRGIQNIYPQNHSYTMPYYKDTGDLALLAGQKGISSYLVLPTDEIKSTNYLCSHGTGDFKDPNLPVEEVPDWVKSEIQECYFDTDYNVNTELYSQYNNVNFSLNILVNNCNLLALVARLAPFINHWTD